MWGYLLLGARQQLCRDTHAGDGESQHPPLIVSHDTVAELESSIASGLSYVLGSRPLIF